MWVMSVTFAHTDLTILPSDNKQREESKNPGFHRGGHTSLSKTTDYSLNRESGKMHEELTIN